MPVIRTLSAALLITAVALAGCDSLVDHGTDAMPADQAFVLGPNNYEVDDPTGARPTCPCFSLSELRGTFDGNAPQPELFFDTFNWWGLDYRRTEVRSLVETGEGMVEEVAAVYITPVANSQTALMCYRAGVEPDGDGGVEYGYSTKEPTLGEAEACRRVIYAFASQLPCQGPACGMPYTAEQLDPSYPHYNLEAPQNPLHFELKETIQTLQASK